MGGILLQLGEILFRMAWEGQMLGAERGCGGVGGRRKGSGCGGEGSFWNKRTTDSLRPVRRGDLAASVVARTAVSGDGSGGMRRRSMGGRRRGALSGGGLQRGRKAFAFSRLGVGMAEEGQPDPPGAGR